MTLALYGKSRRRNFGLLLGGLLAAITAAIVGLFALTSGNATACACENVSIQVHKYLPKDNVNNPWENQGSSAGNWKFTVYEDNGGTPGAVLVADLDDLTPSAGFPQQDILVKETNTDGDIFFGWFKPDGDGENSGNDKCNQAPADFATGGKYSREEYLAIPASAFGTPGNLTGLLHICAYDKPAPPENHTIQVCKVVEQNNDGVDQGGAFSGEIRHWTAAASFTSVPWSVSGVAEGGEPVCTTVSTIPSGHTFSVVEFGFRPATWVADATGFPWYEDNKGMTHSANGTTIDYTADVKVTFHNKSTAATRNVQVCKVVVGNGDGVSVPAFGYGFDIRPSGLANISGSNSVAEPNPDSEGSQTAEVCATKLVPSDKAFDVVEWMSRPSGWMGDADGYPRYQLNGGALYSNNTTTPISAGTTDVKVTFFNKELPKTKEIVIVKEFTRLNGYVPTADDFPAFTFAPPIDPAPVCTKDESKLPDMVSWTCTVPASWDGTVNESAVDGWESATGCPLVASIAGGPEVFSFCNRPYGAIEILKTDNTTAGNADRPADGDWDFSVSGPSFSSVTSIPFGGGTRTLVHVPLGAGYTATETDGRYGQCPTVSNPTGQGYNTTNVEDGPLALSAPGATITFVFRNDDCGQVLGTGRLEVRKVRDILGDGVMNGADTAIAWNVTITGPEFPGGQDFAVTAGGLHLDGLTEGLYTISEATAAGWNVIGVRTTETPGLVASATTQVNLHNDDSGVVTFYNQPVGQIPVHKEAFRSHNGGQNLPAPQDDDGWTITLTSATCGVTRQAVTDNQGNALFSNLPLCTDYVVTEGSTNADSPGFVPLTAATFTNITPNGLTLTFNNVLRTNDPFEPVTPVPPTPPTATPVPPTATVVPPTTEPTQPPPPATAIAGEKTPGPGQPTPIVPSTGNSATGGAGGNAVFFAGALMVLAVVLGATALGRRPSR